MPILFSKLKLIAYNIWFFFSVERDRKHKKKTLSECRQQFVHDRVRKIVWRKTIITFCTNRKPVDPANLIKLRRYVEVICLFTAYRSSKHILSATTTSKLHFQP